MITLHRKFTYKLNLTKSRKSVFIMKHWLCQVQSQIIFLNVEGHKTMSARKWLMGFTVQHQFYFLFLKFVFTKVSSKSFKNSKPFHLSCYKKFDLMLLSLHFPINLNCSELCQGIWYVEILWMKELFNTTTACFSIIFLICWLLLPYV